MSSHSKEQIAVALEYGLNEAPVVTASGRGDFAKEIIQKAQQTGVPIHQDEDLVELLSMLEISQEIPESLYRLIAEVLVYSYWLRGMKPGDEKRRSSASPA